MSRIPLLALEINAVLHCNLSCRGCSHASPTTPEAFADPRVVERDLRMLADVVTTEELRVLGGEPLLHPQLPELLSAVRTSGIVGRIRVITNGTRLHLTSWDWLERADEVHVSIYPRTSVRGDALAELERRCRALGKGLALKRYEHFRLVWPSRSLTPQEAQDVFDTCQDAHAWSCHTVHQGALYLCPASAPPAITADDERCPLEPTETLRERLEGFLARPAPLRACVNCLGTVGVLVPHQQVARRRWAAESSTGDIDYEHLAAVRADRWADIGCSTDQLVLPESMSEVSSE